jgi:uncharacterized protein
MREGEVNVLSRRYMLRLAALMPLFPALQPTNAHAQVAFEIITFGPGLHMLRDDTSPVKARIKTIKEANPAISFQACGNTQENMQKAENKEIPLIPEATVVKSGVVRVMELQEQGWTHVKP